MTNANDSRNPFIWEDNNGYKLTEPGLTKREYFAAMAMMGLCENLKGDLALAENIAADSVKISDALIEALNKPVPTT